MSVTAGDDRDVRLLTLTLQEPLPGHVFQEMIADHGAEEAARRYRAVVVTTLRQLRGLNETRVRIATPSDEAAEAIRFWLLPRIAERWQMDGPVFRADGWEIDFGETGETFPIHAIGEVCCPFLGSRWLHAATLGLDRGEHQVIGHTPCGAEYLRAYQFGSESLETRILPQLPIVRNHDDWQAILESPLGAAVQKHWEMEA